VNRYNFDSTTQGWVGEAGVVVARVTTPVHDGAGSLRATKTMGAGADSIRFNDAVNVTFDATASGAVLQMWVQVPAGAAGSGWVAHIELQDAGFTWRAGPNTVLTKGVWSLLQYAPAAGLLRACKAIGVEFAATGVGGSQAVYIDTVDQVAETPARWDTELSTTSGAITTGTSTSVSVVSTGGVLWTTDPTHYPLDVGLLGARVRVTAMAGASSPQTATISAAVVNGVNKVIPSGTQFRLWKPARYAL
jgi:hypothetical protein